MKKANIKYVLIAFVLLLMLLVGCPPCVLPGTGTVDISNRLSGTQEITALYLYLTGSDDTGPSIIDEPLPPQHGHSELGVEPGDYTVEAEIDYGAATAMVEIEVRARVVNVVWITDSDIL